MNPIETNVIKPDVKFIENDTDHFILSTESESNLDSKISDIEKYMSSNTGKGKTELEQDELYKNAQILWKEYASCLRDTKYNFYLNRAQFKFLTDLILQKMEYDINSVFFAIELTDLLGGMRETKYSNDKDLTAFPVNATEITYIYHIISKHTVKGLTKDAYLFAQILRRIGSISKVFNYYDTTGKNLSTDVQDWVASFDPNVNLEQPSESGEMVEAEVLEPTKSKKAKKK